MTWFWCQLYNATPVPVRVTILSWQGQGTYYLNPNQWVWAQWFPGQKVVVAFDQWSGQLMTTYPIYINGPVRHTIGQVNINTQPGSPYGDQPPLGNQPFPNL